MNNHADFMHEFGDRARGVSWRAMAQFTLNPPVALDGLEADLLNPAPEP